MAIKPVSVVDSRWERKKKSAKHTSKRRKLKSALKAIFNYMKSDSYLFAPLIYHSQSQIQSSPPLSYDEVSIKPTKEKEKKLAADYLKCDAYMYAPLPLLARDSAHEGTTNPSSVSARVCKPVRRVVVEQSETIERILHRRPFSSKGEVLTHV